VKLETFADNYRLRKMQILKDISN